MLAKISFLLLGLTCVGLSPVVSRGADSNKSSGAKAAAVLQSEQFIIAHNLDKIPERPLIEAGVLVDNQRLSTVMINPGPDPAARHTVDLSKPTMQLIFSALSERHLLLCYKQREREHSPTEYFCLIALRRGHSKLILSGTLYPYATTVYEVIQKLETGSYMPLDNSDPAIDPFVHDAH